MSNRSEIERLQTFPPTSSSLDKHLVDFEKKKMEFIISGRVTSVKLFEDGRLEEANKICDAVLGVEPEDIDTQDLKEEVQYFIQHPDEFELSKLEIGNTALVTRSSSGILNRRLIRSTSERKPNRRKAQLWTFDGISSTNGNRSHLKGFTSCENDSNDEVFPIPDANGKTTSDGNKVSRLYRSQSDSSKPPVSVMQKIQCFEEHARSIATITGRTSSGRLSTTPIKMDSKEPSCAIRTEGGSNDLISISNLVANNLMKGHGHASSQPEGKLIEKVTSFGKAVHIGDINVIPPPRKSPGVVFEYATKIPTPVPITWTELGSNVNKDLREELQKQFFESELLASGCLATFDGAILGVSRGCRVSKTEIHTIVFGMQKREYITSSKITLGGTTYSCLSATGHVVRARIGKLGVNCTTFKKTVGICFYVHPILPKPIGKLVQDIEKFLSDFGY